MPNSNTTAIAVILDRSGSMRGLEEATVAGLNTFMRLQRENRGDTFVTLVQFDDQYEVRHDFRSLKEVPELTAADFQPRGTTALLDAIGRTVDELGKRLADMPEATRPSKVVVVIQTDGQENASRTYTQERIQDMISHQREKYSWEFVFLGANQDAIASATKLGVAATHAATYKGTAVSTRKVFGAMGAMVNNYTSGKSTTVDSLSQSVGANYLMDDTVAELDPQTLLKKDD